MADEQLVHVFMPSLASILVRSEQDKGTPLTQAEVEAIRDRSTVVMVPENVALKITKERGYQDFNPENCWVEFQQLRAQLDDDDAKSLGNVTSD